jgi:hypothetical protein
MNKRDTELKEEKNSIEEKIKAFLDLEPNRENFVALVVYLQTAPDAKIYFQKHYGVKKIITMLKDNQPCYLLLNIFCENNLVF